PEAFRFEDRFNLEPMTLNGPGHRWLLIRKQPVAGSLGLAFGEQLELLDRGETVPTVAELAYAVTIYYWATGVRLFPEMQVRCVDAIKWHPDYHPQLGGFNEFGIDLSFAKDSDTHPDLGLASIALPWWA
ncbi:MAG: hypothetical protein ACREA0_14680, partial [bacterium]